MVCFQKGDAAAEVEAKKKEIEAKKLAQNAKKSMFYKVTLMVRSLRPCNLKNM